MQNTKAEIREQNVKAFESVLSTICYFVLCVLTPLALIIAFVCFIGLV